MFGSGSKDESAKAAGRTSATGGNGNARDKTNPNGARHAASLGAHMTAVNDLRPASSYEGRHRAE